MKIDFSQCGEQEHILDYFQNKTGRFLEIGGYDGISYSNTYALLLNGWSGVLYEPGVIYDKLVQNLQQFPVVCEKKGLGSGFPTRWWDDGGGALGTTEVAHKKLWEKAGAKFTEATMETHTWQQIAEIHGNDFAMIVIDIEGNSAAEAMKLPVEIFPNLQMVVVEHDHQQEYLWTYFEKRGFTILPCNKDLNIIFVRNLCK